MFGLEGFIQFFEQMPTWQRLVWVVICLTAGWIAENGRPLFRFDYRKWSHARVNLTFFVAVAAITVLASGLLSASADTGGPAGGYTWFDSKAPDPKVAFHEPIPFSIPPFSFVVGGDDNWSTADLPFTFNFFGQDYTQVDVSSNGFLSFDIDNPCNDNYNDASGDDGNTIPVPGDCDDTEWGGEPLIAPWFDDLDPGECGLVVAGTAGEAPNRMFIVRYLDVCHQDCDECAAGEGVTFEVILFEGSNDIKIQYVDTFFGDTDAGLTEENRGGTATVGITKDGTTGLQYSANEMVLTDGLAVLFTTGGLPTATPVPTTEPAPPVKGDVDCSGGVNPIDSLKILRFDAGLSVPQEEGCTPVGDAVLP